ncbi:MAG: condensation domain-containing protein, partial [Acidobacteriota bacterium]
MSRTDLLEPDTDQGVAQADKTPPTAGDRPAAVPLSRGQRALWFLDRLAPASGAYVIAAAGRVVGDVDPDALEAALQSLVERHEALRATFAEADGEPVQRVAARMPVPLGRVDAGDRSEADLEQALADEAFRPFDLEHGPLVRLTLFERGAGRDDLVVFAIHHLISDLWSLAVLLRELGAFYDGEGPLPPLETSYADLVARQEERIAGADGEELLELWKRELAGRPESLDLPTDRRRPPTRGHRGAAASFRLGAEHWKRLRKVGRSRGANPFVTGLAALQALLHRLTGQDDLLVGTPTAGRRSGDVSDLVGYCVNPVVVRADASGDPSFGDFLERVRDAGKRAFEHQDLPFPLLVEHLEPGRDASRPPIFQVLFTLQRSRLGVGEGMSGFALGEPGARLELGSLTVESVRLEPRGAQFDLSVFAAEVGGELWGSLVYDRDLFERTTMRRTAARLRRLLEEVAADPDRPLSELSLLAPAERQQLLVEWSGASERGRPAAGEGPERLDALVRSRAAAIPDAVAVVTGGARLSYGELARRAAALAGRLRRVLTGLGAASEVPSEVPFEVRIGVCVPRGPEMVVSLLGVLEAGGAYVPLDA